MHVYVRVHVCTDTCAHKWKPDVKDRCSCQLLSTLWVFFFNMHRGCTHVQMCGVHVMQFACTMYLCMQRPEACILVFLGHFPPYALIWISHLNPELASQLVWLASLLPSSPSPTPMHWHDRTAVPLIWDLRGCCGSELRSSCLLHQQLTH